MMILVRYADGSFRKVPAALLGKLIKSGEVTHFRRASGWVEATSESVRTHFSPRFNGPEKRRRPPGTDK
ncbi:GSU3473 family protein [Trichloromonas sp.]|uniref:GSU3473 family protein n=1 Tax=Trichloromonas sp. TaxID=3069249 RepID=UPI003D8148F1